METFCFNCPQCKQQLEADEEMRGLVVLCPHCEKGIVVPKKKSVSALLKKPQELAPAGGQSREVHGADLPNPNFSSIQRRVEEQEVESQKDDEWMRKIDAASRRQAAVSIIFWMLAAVLIGGGAFYWWKNWRSSKESEVAAVRAAEEMRKRSQEERFKAEQEKRKAESDRRKAEWEKAQAERRKLREQKAMEQKKQQEERDRLRKERRAAEDAAEKAQDEQRQKFRSLVKSLSGMQVDLWRNLAKENRPGNFEGTLHAVIPDINSGETIYEINSHSAGSFDVCTLSRSGEQKKVERETFEKDMLKNGGLVIVPDRAYIVSPQRSTGNLFPMPDSKYLSPSEIELDGLSRLIREYRIDTSALVFAVSYVMPDKKTVVPVETLTFDSRLHRRQILEKVTQHALKSFRPPKTNIKVKRPTVVFYDGKIMKKGMNGVTYVPRNPSGLMPRNYYDMASEARRQESLAEEAKREAERAEQKARESFCGKIANSLDEGRIKIEMQVYGDAATR